MGKGMKNLQTQALEKIGKNWGVSSGTREKLLGCTRDFARFIDKTYHLERIENLKPRMIEAYVSKMKEEGLAPSTMANRMTAVREVCAAVGKQGICAKMNAAYGIERDRINPQLVDQSKIQAIRDKLVQRSAAGDRIAKMMVAADALRREFGLRAKESLMSKDVSTKAGKAFLQVEGAKGGRPRELEVKTDGQMRAVKLVLETAKQLGSGTGRIIPPELTLKQAYDAQRNEWRSLGGTRANSANMHGNRHAYARERDAEGATKAEIMSELGHGQDRSPASYIPR
jgi:site-specific recombinase XerC